MKTIEVNGAEYELEGEPTMRVVKYVQELQIDILQDHLSEEQIMQMDSMGDDEVMSAIMESGDGVDNLKDMMWKNNLLETVQTIILATNEKFSLSEFDEMGAHEFKELKHQAEIALGSKEEPQTAQDFMAQLGIGISSKMKELQEQAQAQEDNSSQEPLLTE